MARKTEKGAGAIPPLMVVTAHVTDQWKRLAPAQPRHLLQYAAAPYGVGLHDLEFFLGQLPRLVEDSLGNCLLSHIVEQGQGGIHLDFLGGQRGDDAGSREYAQQAGCQVMKLRAMRDVIQQQPLPAQDGKRGFYVQKLISY